MKKTLLVGALSLLASGAALANGFYAGIGAGGLQLNDQLVETLGGTTETLNEGELGVNGALMAGYQFAFANRMLLNLEAFGNYTSANVSESISDYPGAYSEARLQYVYGAHIMPGFQTTDSTAFYGILGVARGYFKNSGELFSNDDDGTYSLNGYQLGLATMTDVSKNMAIRTDVIYTAYQSKTFYNLANTGVSLRYEPSTVEFNVVAVYKFG